MNQDSFNTDKGGDGSQASDLPTTNAPDVPTTIALRMRPDVSSVAQNPIVTSTAVALPPVSHVHSVSNLTRTTPLHPFTLRGHRAKAVGPSPNLTIPMSSLDSAIRL